MEPETVDTASAGSPIKATLMHLCREAVLHCMAELKTAGPSGVRGSPHFLDQTARKLKVRLEAMADRKPSQLKVSSDMDAMATPSCTTFHIRASAASILHTACCADTKSSKGTGNTAQAACKIQRAE